MSHQVLMFSIVVLNLMLAISPPPVQNQPQAQPLTSVPATSCCQHEASNGQLARVEAKLDNILQGLEELLMDFEQEEEEYEAEYRESEPSHMGKRFGVHHPHGYAGGYPEKAHYEVRPYGQYGWGSGGSGPNMLHHGRTAVSHPIGHIGAFAHHRHPHSVHPYHRPSHRAIY